MAAIAPLLRVAIFASSRLQPRALVEAFARIAESAFAEIVLIAAHEGRAARPPWLRRAYQHMDNWGFGHWRHASENVDLVAQVSCRHTLPIPEGEAASPPVASWRAEVDELALDVAFTLGEINPEVIFGTARYGIWQLDLDEQQTRPKGRDGGRDTQRRQVAHLPGRALLALYRAHVAELSNASLHAQLLPHPALGQAPDDRPEPVRSLVDVGWRLARRGVQKLFYIDQWFIAYCFTDAPASDGSPAFGPFSCLAPPPGHFWSDPFPLLRDGRYFIFFEELVLSHGKAHISVVEVGRDGQCSAPTQVLEQPYPVSAPFLIESGEQLFMVPGSSDNGTVELYVCEHFPERWRLEKVLLHAKHCANAQFFQTGNSWWMFVNVSSKDSDIQDELHLYYADHLAGEWLPHRANPIKSDLRSAHSAGRLYRQAGQLYRPARIDMPLHGADLSINKVIVLNRENYLENEVDRIIPVPASDILGLHTLNRAGALNVLDGFTRRRRMGGKTARLFQLMLASMRESGHVAS